VSARGTAPRVERASTGQDDAVDLRRIKLIGVVLPTVFVVALETLLLVQVTDTDLPRLSWVALFAVPVLGVAGFAGMMFHLIDRAQERMVVQNHELNAANTVSAAIQGELDVPQIVDAALHSVLRATSAVEVAAVLLGAEADCADETRWSWRRLTEDGALTTGPDALSDRPGRVLEIPLSTSARVIGRLRLRLPEHAGQPEDLSLTTMRGIGLQVGSAIQIAQLVGDLQRRRREGHGFYDVLLQISNQNPCGDVLAAVVRHARELLDCDGAGLCVTQGNARLVEFGELPQAGDLDGDGGVCTLAESKACSHSHGRDESCPVRSAASMCTPVRLPDGNKGELWIGRTSGADFTDRDREFLTAMAGLAEIALSNASMREHEQQGAILAERERIAREMHDSLAQVLGATHLRLRSLTMREEVGNTSRTGVELTELADVCEEAYRDVREAILGLRESSRADRGLLESLHAYVERFSHQSGITTTLVSTLDHELVLSPRCEVQIIRVIQEALTNVRKHAGACSVVVRVSETDEATTFAVEDDGHGFDLAAVTPDGDGFGLHAMRERLSLVGGSLTLESMPGRGTRVVADVPSLSRTRPTPAGVSVAEA
jgi:two-component system nitrate/nitrite sensor histidine kinase NarX